MLLGTSLGYRGEKKLPPMVPLRGIKLSRPWTLQLPKESVDWQKTDEEATLLVHPLSLVNTSVIIISNICRLSISLIITH